MSECDWWYCYGPFKRWRECPSRPDIAEVLLFSLEKREIPPEEYIPYLCKLLELQKSMIYSILKGEGLDSITRCRKLVRALQIHPPLLGIDAKYYPIERFPYWWRELGFDFHADAEGYPVLSEVIRYFRLQRTLADGKGGVKVWSQEDLGEAAGLKKETIYRMENDLNPLNLENMSRRALIASVLGTLAGEQEPIIFCLFGLDPQAYGIIVSARDVIPEVHFRPVRLTEEILREYQQKLAELFDAYYTGHTQHLLEDAHAWLRRVEALSSLVETRAQRIHLLALQCRSHQVIAALVLEQHNAECISYTALAVKIAEEARKEVRPQLGEYAWLTFTTELLAAALLWQVDTYCGFNDYIAAQNYIDQALDLLPELQSIQLKIHIVAGAGLIHAHTAASEVDRALVLSYFDLAAQLNASIQCQLPSATLDEHFVRGDTGLLYLYKAMALSAPPMRGTTKDSVLDLLETAERLTPPELLRQQAAILVLRAQAFAAQGDNETSIEVALDALEKSRQIRSHMYRERIEDLYERLLHTDARDQPHFSYLGVKLRTWEYGMH